MSRSLRCSRRASKQTFCGGLAEDVVVDCDREEANVLSTVNEPSLSNAITDEKTASLAGVKRIPITSVTSASVGIIVSGGGKPNKKKGVVFSDDNESPSSAKRSGRRAGDGNDSASSKAKKISDREARSRRRQALMDEPSGNTPPPTPEATDNGKRKVSGAAAAAVENKRRRLSAAKKAHCESSPVTKVKFLTGTLYIYRGKQRRVEFVRRI